MQDSQIALVQSSFARVVPIREAAAEIFYADLFETAPQVRPLFAKADMKRQGAVLMATLGAVVNGLRDLTALLPVARDLAVRHVGYGVEAAHYPLVGAALLRTLEKGLGEAFTPEVREAWATAYGTLSAVMVEAAYPAADAAE